MWAPPKRFTTTQGTYSSQKYVNAQDISFHEFCKPRRIQSLQIRLFNSPASRYDIIVGRNVLTHGFVLDHARRVVAWDGLSIPMVPTNVPYNQTVPTYFSCVRTATDVYNTGTAKILDGKYDRVTPNDIVRKCTHVTLKERTQLQYLISSHSKIFSGKLVRYVKHKFSVHLKDTKTPPIFCTPYPISIAHQQVFEKELQHLMMKDFYKELLKVSGLSRLF